MAPSATAIDFPPPITHNAAKKALRSTTELPKSLIDEARAIKPEAFDATKHVCFQQPEKIYTMEEVGFQGKGISSTAVSAPFPLFTQDAVKQMRAEVFSERVLNECRFKSSFVKDTVRGMMPHRAPFTYDAWHSEEVLSRISQVAGVDLVPVMDMEISAINISINDQAAASGKAEDEDIKKAADAANDDSAFAWHYDSYPFVCVTMLSDCTGMVGGETALKTATGEIMKVRGPAMVCLITSPVAFNNLLTDVAHRAPLSLCKDDISTTQL